MTHRTFTNIRAVLLTFLIIAASIACHGPQIEQGNYRQGTFYTFWEVKNGATGDKIDVQDVDCYKLRLNFRVCCALTIIAICFYFFMLLICLTDLVSGGVNKAVSILYQFFNLVSFTFILTSWALVARFRHSDGWCGYNPKNEGYTFAYGFALLVTVWCTQVLVEIVRLYGKKDVVRNNEDTNNSPDGKQEA